MLLNKEELAIMNVFRKNINRTMSITEIQKASKKASKPYVFNTLKKLARSGLIEKTIVGTSGAYNAKLAIGTVKYFSLLDIEDFENSKVPKKIVQKLIEELNSLKIPYCILIFGSYAKGKATEESDVDIGMLVGDSTARKAFGPVVESISLREIIPLHIEIITTHEFFEMLLSKEANLGKEIAYNHIIVFGNEIYYQVMGEAYKHGYSG